MKRLNVTTIVAASLVVVLIAAMSIVSSQFGAAAQDEATTHPIVGAWLLTVDVSGENDPPHLVIYHADGTYTDAAAGRGGGVGVWEAIDDQTVVTNVLFHTEAEDGSVGLTRIRTESSVDESGNAYTSDYTREVIAADGTSTGELGPGSGSAVRITAEPKSE